MTTKRKQPAEQPAEFTPITGNESPEQLVTRMVEIVTRTPVELLKFFDGISYPRVKGGEFQELRKADVLLGIWCNRLSLTFPNNEQAPTDVPAEMLPITGLVYLGRNDWTGIMNRDRWLSQVEVFRVMLLAVKSLGKASGTDEQGQTTPTAEQVDSLDAESRAIAVIARYPNLTSLEEVATMAGCKRQYLAAKGKCLRFKAVWKVVQEANNKNAKVTHGSKTKDGSLEAWK